MNKSNIITKMNREQLSEAVEMYWNKMLVDTVVVDSMEIHARGNLITVHLAPEKVQVDKAGPRAPE